MLISRYRLPIKGTVKFLSTVGLFIFIHLTQATAAKAVPTFDPTDASKLQNSTVKTLVQTAAIGADFRAYMPASPQGLIIGLDVGVDTTALILPQDFQDALKLAGVQPSIPGVVLLPRLNIHKGLPAGIDVGFSYIGLDKNRIVGADVKYALLAGGLVSPSLALRATQTWSKLFFMNTRTTKFDVIASKSLLLIEPYAGAGMEFGSGDIDVPLNGPNGLQSNVSGHQSSSAPHIFVGLPLNLLLMHITAEYDHSFLGINTYGAKISLGF